MLVYLVLIVEKTFYHEDDYFYCYVRKRGNTKEVVKGYPSPVDNEHEWVVRKAEEDRPVKGRK